MIVWAMDGALTPKKVCASQERPVLGLEALEKRHDSAGVEDEVKEVDVDERVGV